MQFTSNYDCRVVIYPHRNFIRLATGIDVTNKFQSSAGNCIATILLNKALWLDVAGHVRLVLANQGK